MLEPRFFHVCGWTFPSTKRFVLLSHVPLFRMLAFFTYPLELNFKGLRCEFKTSPHDLIALFFSNPRPRGKKNFGHTYPDKLDPEAYLNLSGDLGSDRTFHEHRTNANKDRASNKLSYRLPWRPPSEGEFRLRLDPWRVIALSSIS